MPIRSREPDNSCTFVSSPRNGDSANEFANAIVSAGIRLGTPATVLSDGDAGLWKLQRQVMPKATLVLDWWHIAMRFEHALQAARGLGAGAASAYLSKDLPVGSPDGLNRQPHSEQPKPRKRSCSIHIILRLMAASLAFVLVCLVPAQFCFLQFSKFAPELF